MVEPNIERDILALTRVDKPALLKRLFELGAAYSGQRLPRPDRDQENSHRELWSAIRNQLIERYATRGHGIYLVFWFGPKCTPRPPSGDRPAIPDNLREQLEAILSTEVRRRILVRVIDVSAPPRDPEASR